MSRWRCAVSLFSLALLVLATAPARADLFVSSVGTNEVLEYNGTSGAFLTAFVPTGSGGLNGRIFLTFSPSAPPPAGIPEPSSLALLGLGTAALAGWRRHAGDGRASHPPAPR